MIINATVIHSDQATFWNGITKFHLSHTK